MIRSSKKKFAFVARFAGLREARRLPAAVAKLRLPKPPRPPLHRTNRCPCLGEIRDEFALGVVGRCRRRSSVPPHKSISMAWPARGGPEQRATGRAGTSGSRLLQSLGPRRPLPLLRGLARLIGSFHTSVPQGTLMIRSLPAWPSMPLPMPPSPSWAISRG